MKIGKQTGGSRLGQSDHENEILLVVVVVVVVVVTVVVRGIATPHFVSKDQFGIPRLIVRWFGSNLKELWQMNVGKGLWIIVGQGPQQSSHNRSQNQNTCKQCPSHAFQSTLRWIKGQNLVVTAMRPWNTSPAWCPTRRILPMGQSRRRRYRAAPLAMRLREHWKSRRHEGIDLLLVLKGNVTSSFSRS